MGPKSWKQESAREEGKGGEKSTVLKEEERKNRVPNRKIGKQASREIGGKKANKESD